MALKAAVESLEQVDEGVRNLYVEKDGKFVLDLEDLPVQQDVSKGTQEKINNLLAQAKKNEQKAKEEAQKREELQKKIEAMEEEKAAAVGNYKELYTAREKELQALKAQREEEKRLAELEKEQSLIDSTVRSIAAKLFGQNSEILAPSIRERVKIFNIEDENNKMKKTIGLMKDDGEILMSNNEFEQYLREHKSYSMFIPASNAMGSGSKGNLGPVKEQKPDTSKLSPTQKMDSYLRTRGFGAS